MIGAIVLSPAAGFDYDTLDLAVRSDVQAAALRIKGRMRSAIIDVGRDLLDVKERLPHGLFGAWLKDECHITDRTAQLYMSAARLADECETVSHLRVKTIYTLAAPSTPGIEISWEVPR